jgi:hypothetical protein
VAARVAVAGNKVKEKAGVPVAPGALVGGALPPGPAVSVSAPNVDTKWPTSGGCLVRTPNAQSVVRQWSGNSYCPSRNGILRPSSAFSLF